MGDHEEAQSPSSPDASAEREKEFYRYYQPRSYGLEFLPTHSTRPRSSPDKALTAICQLAALRLNARRSQISFFDRKNQYILAEATKTSSIQDGSAEVEQEKLWSGITCIRRQDSICVRTVEMPLQLEQERDVTAYVIPDMTKDSRVKHSDIVARGGNARFYAGVPIRSPKGHAIGAYCIIDDEPRDGLKPSELSFLKDMATVIMVHLDRTRASEASLRSERMLRGLGSFVEGNYAVQDWWMSAGSANAAHNETLREHEGWSDRQFAAQKQPTPKTRNPTDRAEVDIKSFAEDAVEDHKDENANLSADSSLQPVQTDPAVSRQTSSKQQEVVSTDVKSTFSRAANLIRDVTQTEQAIFFDASVGSFGGLVDANATTQQSEEQEESDDGSDTDASEASTGTTGSRYDLQKIEQLEKPCEVLGFAAPDRCSLDGHAPVETAAVMTEGFLRSLLQHYPKGKIFNFDEDAPHRKADSAGHEQTETRGGLHRTRSGAPRVSKRNEAAKLREIFPHVRSLAIVPIFDASKDAWFAGGIVWSTDPMRILSSGLELSYLAAFGNSIMAEVHRLEAKRADFAKTKFIGSVSHELRSPLHGILGSVECLQDTELDAFQENLLHTVETCGKTLLDTIDHLLDFAKINNFTSTPRDKRSDGKPSRDASSRTRNNGEHKKNFALDVDVDLSVITEEVMETVFAGHDFSTLGKRELPDHDDGNNKEVEAAGATDLMQRLSKARRLPSRNRKVAVILDIDKAAESHWIFRTQAGAWRRIVMNLFGNALKYTDKGFIHLRLTAEPLPSRDRSGKSNVALVVTDSGRGMSKEYLDNQLFTPFAQENTLAPGTGLGLSIVQQIVQSLGGSIDVKSEKGRGTEITVNMALHHAPRNQDQLEQSIVASMARDCKGLKIGFVGFEADSYHEAPTEEFRDAINSNHHFMNSFHKLCRNWFDMDMLILENGLAEEEVDVFLSTERGADDSKDELVRQLDESQHAGKRSRIASTPLLVLCDAASTAQSRLQRRSDHQVWDMAEFISQPCGPRKLAKALSMCLERRKSPADVHNKSMRQPSTSEQEQGQQTTDDAGNSDRRQARTESGNEAEKSTDAKAKLESLTVRRSSTRSKSEQDTRQPEASGNDQDRPTDAKSSLPIRSSSSQKRKANKSDETSDNGPPKQIRNVLLVDDNNINLQLLVNYMKKNKHNYVTATNGQEAVDAFKAACTGLVSNPTAGRTRPFDYILMDISMPIMDGLEATRHIRAHELRQHRLSRSNTMRSVTSNPKTDQADQAEGDKDVSPGSDITESPSSPAKPQATTAEKGDDVGHQQQQQQPQNRQQQQQSNNDGGGTPPPATIVALTGLASAEAQHEAYSSGIDIFMTKPVRLAELSKILGREG